MTPSEIARAMARYILEHGFSPEWLTAAANDPWNADGCGCFAHAWGQSGAVTPIEAGNPAMWDQEPIRTIQKVIGTSLFESALHRAGWTEGCTDDAAAACEIAADLLA